jgi:thiamine pyrophosphate-dependent acetolactate synthase large subunit-like protein
LAIAQPTRPVIVVEGDGALLMHMGTLVTVGAVNPANLTVLLIKNGVHAASGGQALTNAELDLAQLARASGIAHADNIAKPEALAAKIRASTARDGAECLALATEPDLDVVRPPATLEPVLTKHRFMTTIGAPRYIPTLFGGGTLEDA